MGLVIACCSASIVLAGCASSTPAPSLPMSVGNGAGSQYGNGNYAAQMDGEMGGPSGERRVVFNWDRPLTKDLALRLRSASCDSAERPGWMVSREISRTVIPIAESNVRGEQGEAGQ